jgi:hypothetical protein
MVIFRGMQGDDKQGNTEKAERRVIEVKTAKRN